MEMRVFKRLDFAFQCFGVAMTLFMLIPLLALKLWAYWVGFQSFDLNIIYVQLLPRRSKPWSRVHAQWQGLLLWSLATM